MLNKGLVVIYPSGRGVRIFRDHLVFSGEIRRRQHSMEGVLNIDCHQYYRALWGVKWILSRLPKSSNFPPPPPLAVYYKSSILSPEQDDSNALRDWLDIFNFVIVCSEFVFFLLQLQILNSKEKLESQRKLWKEVWYNDVKVITLSRKTCKVTFSIKIVAEVGETWENEKLGNFIEIFQNYVVAAVKAR